MSEIAIRVEGLSKRYTLGALRRRRPDSLRELLVESARSLVRRNGRPPAKDTSLWALQDVSFEVAHAEVLGLIGRNGSGKSTLLKILTRITQPTAGRAQMYGRVASLLEVGTGFDRDLTGRENIYLSGAILGMRRAEIRRKFDEIVAFAEIERFIDTPVKRYSSGMYVRLAFAVAAHLEPEILLVDEVLAVGDARFQKKCLAKMQEFGHAGRTVLFVSHSMPAITRLCQRAILLDRGRLVTDGPASQVVSAYLSAGSGTTAVREWSDGDPAPGGRAARLRAVRVLGADGQPAESLDIREPVTLAMEFEVLEDGHFILPSFRLENDADTCVLDSADLDPAWHRRRRPRGRYASRMQIPGNLLNEGRHYVTADLGTLEPNSLICEARQAVAFTVVELEPGSARGVWTGEFLGAVRPALPWTTEFRPHEAASPALSGTLAS